MFQRFVERGRIYTFSGFGVQRFQRLVESVFRVWGFNDFRGSLKEESTCLGVWGF